MHAGQWGLLYDIKVTDREVRLRRLSNALRRDGTRAQRLAESRTTLLAPPRYRYPNGARKRARAKPLPL